MATTTGFVQSYVLGAGPFACAWIGPEPDDTELIFTTTMTRVLAQAQVTGRQVEVTHPDDSAEATSVELAACDPAATALHLDGIEVTQSVQDLAQSVPLVAGKGTVVRVYLGNSTAAALTVRGTLSVRPTPSDPPTLVPSTADAVLDPALAGDLPAQRNQLGRSLDFVLPATSTAEGSLVVALASVTDAATGAVLDVGCQRRPTVWFHRSPPLRLRVIGLRYTMNGVTRVPSDDDFELLASWLRRAYPVADVVESRVLVTSDTAAPFTSGDANAQVAAIRAIDVDSGEDNRTHYYGFVSDLGFFMRGSAAGIPSAPDPTVVASGPTGPDTWGWDVDGSYGDWYGGHELGHTFGRRHPGFCGETQSDLDNYPFANGALARDDDSFCGYDVGDPLLGLPPAVLPGLEWRDVMTYCDRQWLSPYTYQGIRLRLLEEDALGSLPPAGAAPLAAPVAPVAIPAVAGPPAGAEPAPAESAADAAGGRVNGRPDGRVGAVAERPPVRPGRPAPAPVGGGGARPGAGAGAGPGSAVSVVATVTGSTGSIRHVHPVPNSEPSPPDPDSPYALRVLGADGRDLGTVPVTVQPGSEEGDGTGLITAVLAAPAGAAAIELRHGDRAIAAFRAGGDPGGGARPPVRASVSGDEVVLDLGRDAGPGTSYLVQVSDDDGSSWRTTGVGVRAARVVVDRREARRGSLRVRVTATDGFTSAVVADETVRT